MLTCRSTYLCPSAAITQLAWKPSRNKEHGKTDIELAIASEDSSLRIYTLNSPSVES